MAKQKELTPKQAFEVIRKELSGGVSEVVPKEFKTVDEWMRVRGDKNPRPTREQLTRFVAAGRAEMKKFVVNGRAVQHFRLLQ